MKNTTNNLQQLEKLHKQLENSKYCITNNTIKNIELIINNGKQQQEELIKILIQRLIKNKENITVLDGIIFNKLQKTNIKIIQNKLNSLFPQGILNTESFCKNNYQPLQDLLINQNFQEADTMTQKYLCKLANLNNTKNRQWLYFTDINTLPAEDLLTIDLLWRIYSDDKFGFSIQRQIWTINNCDWDKFWTKIGWTNNGIMRKYPEEFIWTLNAPKGHLPLFNQLRGNKVLFSLFQHSVWNKT